MAVSGVLFQLQEIDLQIEAREKAIQKMTADLGESQLLRDTRASLTTERKRLHELTSEQRDLELQAEDLSGKIKSSEKDLYSGRISVPKELSNLQQEITALKSRRSHIEDISLNLMEQLESARNTVDRLGAELKTVEEQWKSQQADLRQGIEDSKKVAAELTPRRDAIAAGVAPESLLLYQRLRKQKGTAVARVEQGICRGCRISLPSSDLQRVRGGTLVQCSSCGRILFLP
jgi:uncharacterized protein